jgi:preprotein translocase subunit SecE
MLLWGLILTVAGVVAALCTFLDSLHIFSNMAALGFGTWIANFFNPANFSAKKIIFFIGAAVLLAGIVMIIVGAIKAKVSGEHDKQTEKGIKFFRDLKGEFKKITWPTFSTVVRNTCVTLAVCVILGVIIVVIDFGCSALIKLLQSL